MAAFDVEGARKAGYSDADIAGFLASTKGFDADAASKAGYSSAEIISHLSGETAKPNTGFGAALQQGVANVAGGIGETIKQYGPEALQGVGEALSKTGADAAPANYQPAAPISKERGVQLSETPRALVEASPGIAASLAAARLTPGPWWAKALAGGLAGTAQSLGPNAKEAGEKVGPALAAVPSTILGSLGVGRLLPGGAGAVTGVGAKGVTQAAGKLATTAAIEGGVEAGQNAIEQVGKTAAKGVNVDPYEVANSAVVGAAGGTAFGAPRAAKDAGGAIKYRNFDTEAAARVANRLQATGTAEDPRGMYDAVTQVEKDIAAEITRAAKDVDSAGLSDKAANALNRAKSGNLEDADIEALPSQLSGLASEARAVRQLKQLGTFADGQFKGGGAAKLERGVRLFTNPTGVVGAGLLGQLGGADLAQMVQYSPHALAALGGTYLAARGIDKFTGNRSPGKRFVEKFADPDAVHVPRTVDVVPPPPRGPWGDFVSEAGPTGPRIAQPPRPPVFSQVPKHVSQSVMDEMRRVNRVSKNEDRQTIAQAMPLIKTLSKLAKRAPWASPEITDITTPIPRMPLALPKPDWRTPAVNAVDNPAINMGAPQEPLALPPPRPVRGGRPAVSIDGDVVVPPTQPQPLALPPGNGAINAGAPAPQLALPVPDAAQLPAVLGQRALVKFVKREGKVVETPKKVPAATVSADDLDIPDFLRRAPKEVVPNKPDVPVRPRNSRAPRPDIAQPASPPPEAAPARTVVPPEVLQAAVARLKAQQKALPPAPTDAELDIPNFLKRGPDNTLPRIPTNNTPPRIEAPVPEPVKKVKLRPRTEAPAPKAILEQELAKVASEASIAPENPIGKSQHFAKTPAEVIKNIMDEVRAGPKAAFAGPEYEARVAGFINKKFDMARALKKAIKGFDAEEFTSSLIKTMSHGGGNALKAYVKAKYPGHDDAVDSVMSEKAFSSIYVHKTSSKDGTAKPRKKK